MVGSAGLVPLHDADESAPKPRRGIGYHGTVVPGTGAGPIDLVAPPGGTVYIGSDLILAAWGAA